MQKKNIVDRIVRVWYEAIGDLVFFDKDNGKFQEKEDEYILVLEPFDEILIRQVFFTDVVRIELRGTETLEEKVAFLEWDSCDVALEQVERFNQLFPQHSTNEIDICSSVSCSLQTLTDLPDGKVLIGKEGRKEIALRENLSHYNLGETLFDSEDDSSDRFCRYTKKVQRENRCYFTVTASASNLHAICFGAPYRIPFPEENFTILTDPPKMSILVDIEHVEEVAAYLDNNPCHYQTSQVFEWVPMTEQEKQERQALLRSYAEKTVSFYEFFSKV